MKHENEETRKAQTAGRSSGDSWLTRAAVRSRTFVQNLLCEDECNDSSCLVAKSTSGEGYPELLPVVEAGQNHLPIVSKAGSVASGQMAVSAATTFSYSFNASLSPTSFSHSFNTEIHRQQRRPSGSTSHSSDDCSSGSAGSRRSGGSGRLSGCGHSANVEGCQDLIRHDSPYPWISSSSTGSSSGTSYSSLGQSVETLRRRLSGPHEDEAINAPSEAAAPPALGPDRLSWSAGAALHEQGNCKPCMWNWKAMGCANAETCQFCHMCPSDALMGRIKLKLLKQKKAAAAARAQAGPAGSLPDSARSTQASKPLEAI